MASLPFSAPLSANHMEQARQAVGILKKSKMVCPSRHSRKSAPGTECEITFQRHIAREFETTCGCCASLQQLVLPSEIFWGW
jgi:hypothetical protein